MDPVPQGFAKRAAASPLISEFDKKPKLGLTDEESQNLNNNQKYVDLPTYGKPEDVRINTLVVAFRAVAIDVPIMKEWKDSTRCERYIKGLSHRAQLDLASLWIEARDKEDWTSFANYRALRPFHRCATVATALYSYKSGPISPTWQDSGIG